jgi:RNA polymerase sigma factor (sigma-70 family)
MHRTASENQGLDDSYNIPHPATSSLSVSHGIAVASLMTDKNSEITAAVVRERTRLGSFIRRRVRDPGDAEDILQDVLQAFVEAYRLPEPIEQVGAWLFRVARNRIIDRFRGRRDRSTIDMIDDSNEAASEYRLDLVLPALDADPEAIFARSVVLDELQRALDELPADQREVFIAHELEGRPFKDLALRSGVGINTLLARKRYAVLYLRRRLQTVYDELDL